MRAFSKKANLVFRTCCRRKTRSLICEKFIPTLTPSKTGSCRKASAKTLVLYPAFKKDGTVTAGNASGINDGAAAFVVMSADKAKEVGD